MTRFQLHDTVALKADRSLVGNVDRTSYLDSEPLDDCLIIAHVEVPSHILTEFCVSGVPPRGYVFVVFADQEQGSSLVSDDDLILLDRVLDLGDVVKRENDQVIGTVVNVSNSYTLAPVWRRLPKGRFAAEVTEFPTTHVHECDASCDFSDSRFEHPRPYELINNVPFEELKRAQDFIEGDYVVADEWLGRIDECDLNIAILLQNNSVVIVQDPDELYIPVPEFNKPLVSLPEFDGLRRPDFMSASRGWSQLIPPTDIQCGQMVVTSPRNLRNGRWLRGSYNDNVRPQGRVVMVRTRHLSIRWLACNAFAPMSIDDIERPDMTLPYENLSSFPKPQEIRRDKRLVLYDPSKHANILENCMRRSSGRAQEAPLHSKPSQASPINLSSTFTTGERVKFRDAAGAAVKYQGTEIGGVYHQRFDRILPVKTYGFDLNEFKIVGSQQKATINWQDGTVTENVSTSLVKFNLFESDLVPGDLVVGREGMKQRPEPENYNDPEFCPTVDFNEMTFFEKAHNLLPEKVGVIQNVNPSERVAQVRWFSNPKIRLTSYGNGLGGDSRFGPLTDEVEDVSLYEVMTFPGITRRLRDIVIIPPRAPSTFALNMIQNLGEHGLSTTFTATALSHMDGHQPIEILEWIQYTAMESIKGDEPQETIDDALYKPHRKVDWVGEIVQIGTDGTVTVRIDAGRHCKDVVLEHDQILCFVDDNYLGPDFTMDPMDLDDDEWGSISENSSAAWSERLRSLATESVEYEGGKRLDNDSGDENWESEEEDQQKGRLVRSKSIAMEDVNSTDHENNTLVPDIQLQTSFNDQPTTMVPSTEHPLTTLKSHLPLTEPLPFAVLEREAPQDQFRQSHPASTSPSFLKRIAKEHRVLNSALPKHEIYVRTYESRLDLIRCLIIGPADTPYEHAPFLIDLHLGPNFPHEPPTAHFHSWTSGLGRINPNLYEEGKICLSLLGTWPGKSETEGWSEKSTILQLLISLQGLVFVKAPFYNEAGFEDSEREGQYKRESLQYAEKAFVMARGFVKHALTSPVGGLEDVLAWLYLPHHLPDSLKLLEKIVDRGKKLILQSEEERRMCANMDDAKLLDGSGSGDDATKVFLKPLSKGAVVMLQKTVKVLEDMIQKHADL